MFDIKISMLKIYSVSSIGLFMSDLRLSTKISNEPSFLTQHKIHYHMTRMMLL